jgi:isovaleryl-CoA dehydrogenase
MNVIHFKVKSQDRQKIRDAAMFELTPDQQRILDTADAFARDVFYPLAPRMDNEEWFPPKTMQQLASMGFLGITVSPEYGGAGSDLFTSGLIMQALARWNHATALSYAAHENLCVNNIFRNANEDVKQRYLPGLCDGSIIGALGLTEPGAGSDALGSMATTARREGDTYVLNGRKLYITNGPVAGVVLVYAKTDKAAGHRGISAFLVETSAPGFKVAQKLDKMGYRGSTTAELVFDDCIVPAANLVGEENRGVGIVMSGLDLERATIAMICVGIAERALDLAVDYAKTRTQFGKPIGEFQMVQAKLADMYVGVETAKAFAYRALAACNDADEETAGRGELHKLTAASILYAAETSSRVVDASVQIHGGTGYMRETEINRLYRAVKLLEIGAGTTEVRKMIIAGELLR